MSIPEQGSRIIGSITDSLKQSPGLLVVVLLVFANFLLIYFTIASRNEQLVQLIETCQAALGREAR